MIALRARPLRRLESLPLFGVILSLPAMVHAQPAPLAGLPDYVRSAMELWGVPGLAIAIVKDGETVWSAGFGVPDGRTGGLVDENTLFAIGSASKAVITLAVATLVDQGALSWDDYVDRHLFTPLGMDQTLTSIRALDGLENVL